MSCRVLLVRHVHDSFNDSIVRVAEIEVHLPTVVSRTASSRHPSGALTLLKVESANSIAKDLISLRKLGKNAFKLPRLHSVFIRRGQNQTALQSEPLFQQQQLIIPIYFNIS